MLARNVYQYKLFDADACDDPRNDEDPRCTSPDVYIRGDNPLAPSTTARFQTLPRMYREHTTGGNISYFFNRRSWVGVTGYGSTIKWLTGGKDYDFQEWERRPFGGPFGAVGVNGSWGYRWSDLGVEVARSFDSMAKATAGEAYDSKGGGGFAALIRHTAAWGRGHEIETILRYYDTNFVNPYARPLSSPDLYEGQRARDELGGRIRYTGRPNKYSNVRAYVNFWVSPSTGMPAMMAQLRGEYQVTRWLMPAVWVFYHDKDLRVRGPAYCFGRDANLSGTVSGDDADGEVYDDDAVTYANVTGEPLRCQGEQVKLNAQFALTPHRKIKLVPRYQHRIIGDPHVVDPGDDSVYSNLQPEPGQARRGKYRHDSQVWLTVSSRPIDPLRLRARLRYVNWDVSSNEYLEDSLWTFFDVGYLVKKAFLVQLRYDIYAWLDKRETTLARIPSPEHRLMLTLEGRF